MKTQISKISKQIYK